MMTLTDYVVEREMACGVEFGPFRRKALQQKLPHNIKHYLELATLFPELEAVNQSIQAPLLPQGGATASQTAVANTVTETNLWNPALWAPIPAFDMVPGKKYVVEFGGVVGTTGTPVISMRARIGTNNSAPPTGTDLGVSPTMTMGTVTAQPFYGYLCMIVRSNGIAASTTAVVANGYAVMPGAAAATTTPILSFGGLTTATGVDGTVLQGLGVSVIWGAASASNTITCQWVHASSL